MGAYTPRAGLYKPGGGSTGLILPDETVDIDKINANFDKIDALLGARNVPSAASYAGTMDGDLVYAQDTKYLHMYSAGAGTLVIPRLPGATRYYGTNAARDAFTAMEEGDLWASSTDGFNYVYLSGSWVSVNTTIANLQTGTMASNSWTILQNESNWNIATKMVDTNYWNTGLVVPENGEYLVTGSMGVAAALAVIFGVKLNNTGANITGMIAGTSTSGFATNTYMSFARTQKFTKGDRLTPAFFTTGTAGPYGLSPSATHIALSRVR